MARTRKVLYLSCATAMLIAIIFITLFAAGANIASAETKSLSVDVKEEKDITTIHVQNAKAMSRERAFSANVQKIESLVNEYDLTMYGVDTEKITSSDDVYIQVQTVTYDDTSTIQYGSFILITAVYLEGYLDNGYPVYSVNGAISSSKTKIVGTLDVLAIWQGENALYCNDPNYIREGAMYYHHDPSGPPFGSIAITPKPTSGFGTAYEFTTPTGVFTYIVSGSHYITVLGNTQVQIAYIDNSMNNVSVGITVGPLGLSITGEALTYYGEPLSIFVE